MSSFELTPTQQEFGMELIDAIEAAPSKTLFIIHGLDGVGKTSLLEVFNNEIEEAGGVIIPESVAGREVKRLGRDANHVIGSISDTYVKEKTAVDYAISAVRDLRIIDSRTLLSMNREETDQLTGSLEGVALSEDAVARYSLGIPHLVEQITRVDTDEQALGLATYALVKAFGRRRTTSRLKQLASLYLQTPLPDELFTPSGKFAHKPIKPEPLVRSS